MAESRQPSMNRIESGNALARTPLDVLVVGGGIIGAGIARDAAMRGLRVGLIEQSDFASGTSSRSSRLLHGGLRYLAQGHVGLVRQSGRERQVLGLIAPHLARPLHFVFPSRCGDPWPFWTLRAGVRAYDALCGNRGQQRAQVLGADRTRAALPALDPAALRGAVRYYDALTNDARLVIDTLRSAQRAGAIVRNYTRLQRARRIGRDWTCAFRDVLDHGDGSIRAAILVNATGPWAAELAGSGVRLRRTKGVHLVIDRQRLALDDAVVMSAGRRIMFAIPWGRRLILGTTDTDYDGPIDAVGTDRSDVAQILDVVNQAFPGARIAPRDIRATWAGVRPLIATGRQRRGDPSDLSRAHLIRWNADGWLDVAGGKLTTYRLIGQQAVDRIVQRLGRKGSMPTSRTADVPLLDGCDPAPLSAIEPPPVERRAVEHYCRCEWAVHLDDVMTRRTSWRYYVDDPAAVAVRVAQWMAQLLCWDEPTCAAELEAFNDAITPRWSDSAGEGAVPCSSSA